MSQQRIVKDSVLYLYPEIEKPKFSHNGDDIFFQSDCLDHASKMQAYNQWLSSRIEMSPDLKAVTKDGDVLREGVDFEKLDTNKWWYAECDSCGWKGSSQKCGNYQIADTGCCGDVYCPRCNSNKVDETGDLPSYVGIVAIPIQQTKEAGEDDVASEFDATCIRCDKGGHEKEWHKVGRDRDSGYGGDPICDECYNELMGYDVTGDNNSNPAGVVSLPCTSRNSVEQRLLDELMPKIKDLSIVEGELKEVKKCMSSIALIFESGKGYWLRIDKMAEVTLD